METVMKWKVALAPVLVACLSLPLGQPALAQGQSGLDTAAIEQASGLKGQLITEEVGGKGKRKP